MPLYEYCCKSCGHDFARVLRMRDCDEQQTCEVCGGIGKKQLSISNIVCDYPGYECPVTGQWVEGRAAHRENLKRQGCRVLEKGEMEESQRRRRDEEKALEKSLDTSVEQFISGLPTRKLEKLEQEVRAGADTIVERR